MLGGMTSPADADAPAPAQRDAESGWGMKIAAGVVGLMLVVELVLPGFLAAGFCRTGPYVFVWNDSPWDGGTSSIRPGLLRTEMFILAPSAWLMERSETIRRFYYM
jgi:hypothetical protein